MSNKKMTRTEFYKGIMNLENYAPKKAPKQLPAEMIQFIEEEADEYARTYSGTKLIKKPYIAGAPTYAVKLYEAQQEIERLKSALSTYHGVSIRCERIEDALDKIKNAPFPASANEAMIWVHTAHDIATEAMND